MTPSAEVRALDAQTTRFGSRRALLMGALGGAGALIAGAIGRPLSTRAGTDGDIVLGGNNVVSSLVGTTSVSSIDATNGFGGVNGNGGTYLTPAGTSIGVYGLSHAGNGLVGGSGSGLDSGVWGYNVGDGYGVSGSTHGASTAGVWGVNFATGIGVRATSASGNAVQVEGRASFSRSGRANIPSNRAYVDVTVPGGLGAGTSVLATLQLYRSGVYVAACRRDFPTAGKARIYLNKVASTTTSTPVAWFVLG
jgi:hypothetical protein